MAGPSFARLSPIVAAIAADAGTNSAERPQSSFTTIGPVEAMRRTGPPDIVWTVEGAKWDPPVQDESEASRSCAQRVMTCTVAFLGTDFDAADQLVADFGAALFRTQSSWSARITDERHTQQAVAGISRYEIKLSIEVDIPVVYETYGTDSIENTAKTGDIVEELS